jgi:hypothetical protein
MEKVWKAEQKHEAEQKKIEELKRELDRERSRKDILDLKNGGKSERDGLDWMYRGGVVQSQTTEAALKAAVIPDEPKEDFSTPSLLQKKLPSTQDTWAKLNEDPLLEIKRQEQEMLKSITTNPLQMKAIRKELEKSKKKHKKRKRSKSPKKHKSKKSKHHESDEDAPSSKSQRSHRDEEDSHQLRDHKLRDDRDHDSRDDSHRHRHSRNHSRSDRDHDRDRGKLSSRDEFPRHRDSRDSNDSRDSRDDRDSRDSRDDRDSRDSRGSDSNYRRNKNGARGISQMSEEERQRRLREMEQDGKASYDMKVKRYIKDKKDLSDEKRELSSRSSETDASFIS